MRKEVYVKINPIPVADEKEGLNELKISVDYAKGGVNYFNGRSEKRGIYVYFTPVYRSGGIQRSIMLGGRKESGFKAFVRECGRMSQKQIDSVFERVEGIKDKIAELYDKEAYQTIAALVMAA